MSLFLSLILCVFACFYAHYQTDLYAHGLGESTPVKVWGGSKSIKTI